MEATVGTSFSTRCRDRVVRNMGKNCATLITEALADYDDLVRPLQHVFSACFGSKKPHDSLKGSPYADIQVVCRS